MLASRRQTQTSLVPCDPKSLLNEKVSFKKVFLGKKFESPTYTPARKYTYIIYVFGIRFLKNYISVT